MCSELSFEVFKLLDVFLTLFHDIFTIWNSIAWLFKRLRKLHFYTINLTFLSWIGLGYFYGWGYCFLTDIHYQIKACVGKTNLPPSYIQLRILELTGFLPNLEITNWTVGISFCLIFVFSYYFFLQNKNSQDYQI